jgi:NAD(P)-dependent dehydrogenase (short-subunit alcohol dehydrogenase family)
MSTQSTALPKPFTTKEHYKPRQPTPDEIIQEQNITDWSDKVILITGTTSGIGVETARAFAKIGAHLILPTRDQAKSKKIIEDIKSSLDANSKIQPKFTLLDLDLSSLQSVRDCAAKFLSLNLPLHILICNAGIMAAPVGMKTQDGFDVQFGTNHLAHFLLFELLKDTLLKSSTKSFNSRVVMVASRGHQNADINWDDVNFENNYNEWTAYGQSKTANVLMAREIEKRYGSQGLHANALHPGGIMTDLLRNMSKETIDTVYKRYSNVLKSVPQGAATTVWAACAKEFEGCGGYYLEDCSHSYLMEVPEGGLAGSFTGYVKRVYDEDSAKRLYDLSLNIVGLQK